MELTKAHLLLKFLPVYLDIVDLEDGFKELWLWLT